MKKKYLLIFSFLLIMCTFASDISYAYKVDDNYIDIKLTRPIIKKNEIHLKSESGYSIYSMHNKSNSIFDIEVNEIKVILDEVGDISILDMSGNILYTIPKENDLIIKSNENRQSIIKVEKYKYRDYLRFISKNGGIILINHTEIENYLYGLVPKEMPYSFPLEALKAQAVAARTYAMHNMKKHANEGFNLCDTTHCQVYHGYDSENPSTNLAVDETKGLLAYYNGELIDAQYHSTSSGYTEDSKNVWGGDFPYLKSKKDEFSVDSPFSNWTFKIDAFQLNNKLTSNNIYIGLLKGIEIVETSPSGSVIKVKLVGDRGEEVVSGNKFRNIIGNTVLKSTCFNVVSGNIGNNGSTEKKVYVVGSDGKAIFKKLSELSIVSGKLNKPASRSSRSSVISKDRVEVLSDEESTPVISNSEIIINGKGYGHGVGMSQYGAKKMAELGYTFEEILKHYYTDIDIF